MGVDGNGAGRLSGGREGNLGGFDRVVVREAEAEAIGAIQVEGIVVQDFDVHKPFFEVVGCDKGDAGGEGLLQLQRRSEINSTIGFDVLSESHLEKFL